MLSSASARIWAAYQKSEVNVLVGIKLLAQNQIT